MTKDKFVMEFVKMRAEIYSQMRDRPNKKAEDITGLIEAPATAALLYDANAERLGQMTAEWFRETMRKQWAEDERNEHKAITTNSEQGA